MIAAVLIFLLSVFVSSVSQIILKMAETGTPVTIQGGRTGVAAGAVMTWVTLVTELSSSVMLYSYKTITLNLLVYVLVVGGTDARACAASTVLTVFTVATLALYMRLAKNKELSL